MDLSEQLAAMAFFQQLPPWGRELLARSARRVSHRSGSFLARQHEKADTAQFLLSGRVEVLLRFEGTGDLVTEVLSEDQPVIGWSVFRAPHRYTASIRCATDVESLEIPRSAFEEMFTGEPALEAAVLEQMATVVADRITHTIDQLVASAPEAPAESIPPDPAVANTPGPLESADWEALSDSPFFENFTGTELNLLAESATAHSYRPGECILQWGGSADSLHMLVSGKVRLSYVAGNPERAPAFDYQTIVEPGRVMGWSAFVAPYRYRAGAYATTAVRTVAFDRRTLLAAAQQHPALGVRMMRQVLHLLGGRLRETRMRLVARRYEDEVIAIRALIDQNSEELRVDSPLHKLPVFLSNRVTVPDAITAMQLLTVEGDELERSLAASCLDLMDNITRELAIFRDLQSIYQHVAAADSEAPPEQLRNDCASRFAELFQHTTYVIQGTENLPDSSGHIFVMNHLTNDEANKFPSGFQLTIDTHFVSAMILHPRYGRAPIRVIRKSSRDEYGHQMYYDRLGYIYVYRADLDPLDIADGASSAERRQAFTTDAAGHLRRGDNLVICPEGDCTTTEESPLPFRCGAFRLGALTQPEPLIVPISVANFDKRLTSHTLAAVVHPPFRMSEHLPAGFSDADLFAWTDGFQTTFADWVEQTRELAADAESRTPGLHVPSWPQPVARPT